jgi:hypothetical protein
MNPRRAPACLSMIFAQTRVRVCRPSENRCPPIGPSPEGMLFRIVLWRMNSRFFASACASSEHRDRWTPHAFLSARLHQNEQPKLCSEVLIASIVCLHVPSMVDFADAFLAMSTHILRVWSSCAL